MDRLDALKTFVAVAQRQSFAEAARGRRISPAAASRAIAALERDLGVTLLHRTTRSVRLTHEGAVYLERCRAALDELDDAARSLRGEDAQPRGQLIVTAPVVFGRAHVLPIVGALLRAHRGLDVELLLTDRVIRLAEEGVDVAVRIARLADSALHAVRVARVRPMLVASPAYLAARGEPADAAQLAEHDLIAFDTLAPNGEWRFKPGREPATRLKPRLRTNSVEAAIDAAIDGLGITRAFSYQVQAEVARGRLCHVLPALDPPGVPVNILFQTNRRGAPNVRAFVAATQEYLRAERFGTLYPTR